MEKRILFSPHALGRIEERGIRTEWIAITLRHPQRIEVSFRERKIAYGEIEGREIRVIYKEEMDQIIVITAY